MRALALAAVLLAAVPAAAAPSRQPVRVVGDPGSHGPCGPRAIARSLSTFFDAFNRGDPEGLRRLIGVRLLAALVPYVGIAIVASSALSSNW